jgi:hypothetical protein
MQRQIALPEAVRRLSREFDLSERQAYRYLQEASQLDGPIEVPEATVPITLKFPPRTVELLLSLQDIAQQLNPLLRGWIEYYGRYPHRRGHDCFFIDLVVVRNILATAAPFRDSALMPPSKVSIKQYLERKLHTHKGGRSVRS